MKNNILGGLVIFLVVVTCLLLLDDITSESLDQTSYETMKTEQVENQSDLAILEIEE